MLHSATTTRARTQCVGVCEDTRTSTASCWASQHDAFNVTDIAGVDDLHYLLLHNLLHNVVDCADPDDGGGAERMENLGGEA